MDLAHHGAPDQRAVQQARIDLMIPVIKGWMTELGVELTSIGVQVHGGMGYIEETGAAQFLRDVRITPIYEGTNGIQAADLVGRKLGRDGGSTMTTLIEALRGDALQMVDAGAYLAQIGEHLQAAADLLQESTEEVLQMLASAPEGASAAAFDYMMQTGYLFAAWQLARGAQVAQSKLDAGSDNPFYVRKIATTVYYCEALLPRCQGHAGAIKGADGALQRYPVEWL
jgi:hypothetical protein